MIFHNRLAKGIIKPTIYKHALKRLKGREFFLWKRSINLNHLKRLAWEPVTFENSGTWVLCLYSTKNKRSCSPSCWWWVQGSGNRVGEGIMTLPAKYAEIIFWTLTSKPGWGLGCSLLSWVTCCRGHPNFNFSKPCFFSTGSQFPIRVFSHCSSVVQLTKYNSLSCSRWWQWRVGEWIVGLHKPLVLMLSLWCYWSQYSFFRKT